MLQPKGIPVNIIDHLLVTSSWFRSDLANKLYSQSGRFYFVTHRWGFDICEIYPRWMLALYKFYILSHK